VSIELHEEAGGAVLVANVSRTVTDEDYERFVIQVERLIKEHGKLRILCAMDNFNGWEAGFFRKAHEFDLKHLQDIERLAIIVDKASEGGISLYLPFVVAKLRYFKDENADEARRWIYAGLPCGAPDQIRGRRHPN